MRESPIESGKIMSSCTCSLSMLDLDCPLHGTSSKAHVQQPTEMTSLREIKDKLDRLLNCKEPPFDERHRVLVEKLNDVNGRAVWITGFLEGWQSRIDKQFTALAESQGKLLAAIDALAQRIKRKDEMWASCNEEIFKRMDAGLHETAMRNHQQLLDYIRASYQVLGIMEPKLNALYKLRKARKKARR